MFPVTGTERLSTLLSSSEAAASFLSSSSSVLGTYIRSVCSHIVYIPVSIALPCCLLLHHTVLYWHSALVVPFRPSWDKDDEQMDDPYDHLRVRLHTRHSFPFAHHLHRYEYIQLQHQVTSADSPSKYAYSRVTVITSYCPRSVS